MFNARRCSQLLALRNVTKASQSRLQTISQSRTYPSHIVHSMKVDLGNERYKWVTPEDPDKELTLEPVRGKDGTTRWNTMTIVDGVKKRVWVPRRGQFIKSKLKEIDGPDPRAMETVKVASGEKAKFDSEGFEYSDISRPPLSVEAYYLEPLRRKAKHNIPVCDLQIRSFSIRNLEFFCDFALRAAYYLKLPAFGPVPLPKRTERWTVPKSNFVHKKSQENFERVTLRRLIQIKDGHPDTVELWLAFLSKHEYYGLGMKANVFGFDKLGVGQKMSEGLDKLKDPSERPKWARMQTGASTSATHAEIEKLMKSDAFKSLESSIQAANMEAAAADVLGRKDAISEDRVMESASEGAKNDKTSPAQTTQVASISKITSREGNDDSVSKGTEGAIEVEKPNPAGFETFDPSHMLDVEPPTELSQLLPGSLEEDTVGHEDLVPVSDDVATTAPSNSSSETIVEKIMHTAQDANSSAQSAVGNAADSVLGGLQDIVGAQSDKKQDTDGSTNASLTGTDDTVPREVEEGQEEGKTDHLGSDNALSSVMPDVETPVVPAASLPGSVEGNDDIIQHEMEEATEHSTEIPPSESEEVIAADKLDISPENLTAGDFISVKELEVEGTDAEKESDKHDVTQAPPIRAHNAEVSPSESEEIVAADKLNISRDNLEAGDFTSAKELEVESSEAEKLSNKQKILQSQSEQDALLRAQEPKAHPSESEDIVAADKLGLASEDLANNQSITTKGLPVDVGLSTDAIKTEAVPQISLSNQGASPSIRQPEAEVSPSESEDIVAADKIDLSPEELLTETATTAKEIQVKEEIIPAVETSSPTPSLNSIAEVASDAVNTVANTLSEAAKEVVAGMEDLVGTEVKKSASEEPKPSVKSIQQEQGEVLPSASEEIVAADKLDIRPEDLDAGDFKFAKELEVEGGYAEKKPDKPDK